MQWQQNYQPLKKVRCAVHKNNYCLLKAMIIFNVIVDNVAVKMLTTSCIMHPPRLAGHGFH